MAMTGNVTLTPPPIEIISSSNHGENLSSLIFFTIVYILVLLSGLVGNFIVIFVILKNKDLKHFTNYFFANLSAADVFVLIFCIPTAIHDIWAQDQWYMGKFFCKSPCVYSLVTSDLFLAQVWAISTSKVVPPVSRHWRSWPSASSDSLPFVNHSK